MTVQVIDDPHYIFDLEKDKNSISHFIQQVFNTNNEPSLIELKGGITNMLLKGQVDNYQFLIRAYGKGTNTIINRDREYATHRVLESLGLAPKLYARFGNGLIYGFVPGTSIHYMTMSEPEVMKGVANRLAQWHSLLGESKIEGGMRMYGGGGEFSKDIWQLVDKWLDSMPTDVLPMNVQELREELKWLRSKVGNIGPKVVAHCDLLSGNIIVPKSYEQSEADNRQVSYDLNNDNYELSKLVSFIDYEYTMPAPRGFDLANHFMEWQGFDCRLDLIPSPEISNPTLRYWCFHYLKSQMHYNNSRMEVTEQDIDNLIREVRAWWGVPGLYWSIWGAIQSSISLIDFDYANYARSRLQEYTTWKVSMYPKL